MVAVIFGDCGHPLRTRSVSSFVRERCGPPLLRLGGFPLPRPRCLVRELLALSSRDVREKAATLGNDRGIDAEPHPDMVNDFVTAFARWSADREAANAWSGRLSARSNPNEEPPS